MKRADTADTNVIQVPLSFTIDFKDLSLQKKPLGQGAFGIVHKGEHKKTDVAVKQFLVTDLSSGAIQEFINEVQIMANAGHPNIIRVYGYCPSPRCIVMEYMPKGSLSDLLYKGNEKFSWPRRLSIAYDIAAGLRRLHADNILHRDIKSDNILLDRNYTAKLTDFGLSKIKSESRSKTKTGAIGTYPWMAPELDEPEGEYSKGSDIYSLGIVLWELASWSKPPFHKYWDRVERIPGWVGEGKLKKEGIPSDCPADFARLIDWCREVSPEKRPETEAVFVELDTITTNTPAKVEDLAESSAVEYRTRTVGETSDYQTRTVPNLGPEDAPQKLSSLSSQGSGGDSRGGFSEVEALLRSASMREKTKKFEEAQKAFEQAIKKVDTMAELEGIEAITGKVYGLYGEYLFRRDKKKEGNEQLDIATSFGYVPTVEVQSLLKAEAEAKRKADEAKQKAEAEAKLKVEAEAKQKAEAEAKRKVDEAKQKAEAEAKLKAEAEAKQKAEAEAKRKADEAKQKAETEAKLKVEAEAKQKAEAASKKSETSPSNVLLFKGPSPNTQELSQFLRLVAEGEQDQAEAMLQPGKNPDLVLFPGNVKDLSGRTFEGITGFQYAVWALDSHMWTMLLKYLPTEEARVQAQAFETGPWVRTHGAHAGPQLQGLIKALKTYIDNYDAWYKKDSSWKIHEQHWQKQVGGAQLLLPAHVINEYCRPDRSFVPCPAFTEPTLPRTRKIDEGEWFTATYNGGLLGDKFAVLRLDARCGAGVWRGSVKGVWAGMRGAGRQSRSEAVMKEHDAVVSLTKVRVQQRDQLASDLSLDQQHAAQRRPGK